MAEAAGIKARAEALATNTDAVVAQQLAEAYPEIVAAAASSFEKVGNMVVLNGAQGIEDTLVKTITMGGSGFALAKQLIESLLDRANGTKPHPRVGSERNCVTSTDPGSPRGGDPGSSGFRRCAG